jgi:serine/threonine protein kinase
MALTPGTKLGPYEIQSPLGAGGMGEVYRARDTRLERTVAIKILPPHLSSDPVRKQRFEREAKIISSLNHPHICVLHDVGNQDGIDYLVMECLEGETLASNGKRLRRSLGRCWSGRLRNVPRILTKRVLKIPHCERKSNRCSLHTRILVRFRRFPGKSLILRRRFHQQGRSLRRKLGT